MTEARRLEISLLLIRLTIFVVMLMWTVDKFVRPEHAASVYEQFYFLGGLGATGMYVLGGLELVVVAGFVLGIARFWSYGIVLVLHAISTLSSMPVYFDPYGGQANLLFFAAWPMLAACIALFLLRDRDRLTV